jgi:glutathione S-transferase
MSLAHKGLESSASVEGVRFIEKHKLEFTGQELVPVIQDGDIIASDSWDIAVYLEKSYNSSTPLFNKNDGYSSAKFISSWVDSQIHPLIAKCVVRDILDIISASDQAYFRKSREKRFGMSLEEVVKDRANTKKTLKKTLSPMRKSIAIWPFIGGENPNYCDYALFGAFMWARTTSPFQVLEYSDPINAWRDRMLNLYDNLAKNQPCFK